MSNNSVKGDPPSLMDLVATYSDSLEAVANIHDALVSGVAAADVAGDREAAKKLRKQLDQTERVMLDHGLKS